MLTFLSHRNIIEFSTGQKATCIFCHFICSFKSHSYYLLLAIQLVNLVLIIASFGKSDTLEKYLKITVFRKSNLPRFTAMKKLTIKGKDETL